MGIFDGLLPGGGPAFKQPEIDVEGVIGTWSAARTGAGASLAGGQVVLARGHLVFSPWNMDETRAFLVRWLPKAGVAHVATLDKLLTASKLLEPVVMPVAAIDAVQVLNGPSLLKPPQVRLFLNGGRHFDLGILHSALTPNFSAKNQAALDDFLAKLPVARR